MAIDRLKLLKVLKQRKERRKHLSMSEKLYLKYSIDKPMKRHPDSTVCSIGYSTKNNKWYGWSHRAIQDFATRAEAEKFADSVA